MVDFGTVLKTIRKERRMTQQMLADNICSQSVLSRIENNEEIPNVIVLQQLCQRLNVTVDQVMSQDPANIRKNHELMTLLSYYFHSKQYAELMELLSKNFVAEQFHTDTDFQRYYYYLGSCVFYVEQNYTKALKLLQTSLNYTYSSNKHIISDMEILIISCMGKVYATMGNYLEGMKYLDKSIDLFYSLPRERFHYELIKIFYNIATVLISRGEDSRAEELINQGISWSRKQFNYYYLDELFLLKGIILENQGNLEEAGRYVTMANMLEELQ